MSDNLAIWTALERTDPKHVKPITGKTYQGNSPRPHWVIWRLTERFGPVGLGFGWEVIREAYIPGIPHADGTEQLHECRIRFWWREGGERCATESYGGTKALYKAGTKNGQPGYWVSDEDAAKKSLTDAITKAASFLGVAGDIFMGRWDDSKYVAELKAEASKPVPVEVQRQAFRDSLDHDPTTGEVVTRNISQVAAAGLSDAWIDGIKDSLGFDASRPMHEWHPAQLLQYYDASAAVLVTAFRAKKTMRAVKAQWDHRDGLIMDMQEAAPLAYQRVLDAFNSRMAELREPIVMGDVRVAG